MKQERIDIILPVYYEQENIEKVIKGIKKNVHTPHLITIVLQDKKDPTIQIVRQLQKEFKDIHMIFTKNGKGVLQALKEGFLRTKSELIIVMMADQSDDPKDIDKMVSQLNKGYDLVCASRYSKGGKHIGGPLVKGLLSRTACKTLHIFTSIPTNDATNAFKAFKRSLLQHISLKSKEGFALPLELTIKAFYSGYKITEVPTTWRDRDKGHSKFKTWKNLQHYLEWYIYGLKSSFRSSHKL